MRTQTAPIPQARPFPGLYLACNDYYTTLTDTIGAKNRAAPLVQLLHEIAMGRATVHLARKLGLSLKQLPVINLNIQATLNDKARTDVALGSAV